MIVDINNSDCQQLIALTRAVELGMRMSKAREFFCGATRAMMRRFLHSIKTGGNNYRCNTNATSFMKTTHGLFCATEIVHIYARYTGDYKFERDLELWPIVHTCDVFATKYPDYFFSSATPEEQLAEEKRIIDINRVISIIATGMIGGSFSLQKCSCGGVYVIHKTYTRKKCPSCLLKRRLTKQAEAPMLQVASIVNH